MAAANYIFGNGEDAKELLSWLSTLEQNTTVKEVKEQAEYKLNSEISGKLVYIGANKPVYDLLMKCPIDSIKKEIEDHCVHGMDNNFIVTCGKCNEKFKVFKELHSYTCPYCDYSGWVADE